MKISMIGAGHVGSTIAYTLLVRRLLDELVIVDIAEDRVKGEALDLRQGQSGIGTSVKIVGTSDYSHTEGSDIVIVTAGLGRRPGESRLDLAKKNSNIVREIVEKVGVSEEGILFIVTNPVDVMTHLALKVSGFDKSRVFGLGTTLDTVRLRSLLSEEFGASASFSDAFIVGEHGDSMSPVFSHLGQEFERERLEKVFEDAKVGAAEVIKLKGATTFAPALAVAEVIDSIVNDSGRIMPTSTYHEDLGACVGFPSRITRTGARPVEFGLSEEEKERFLRSANIIRGETEKLQES